MADYTELFRLGVRLVLDDSGVNESISKTGKSVSKLGGFFDGAESKATKLATSLSALKDTAEIAGKVVGTAFRWGKQAVEAAADGEALKQSMQAVFSDIGDAANDAFTRVSEANNVNVRRLQQSGMSFFTQFKSAGMDSENALHSMEDALGYAADAAAFYNLSLEDSSEAMRSFIRGNVEAGEKIGLFINQQKREEMAQSKYHKAWKDLTEAERQYLLLDVVGESYKRSQILGQGAAEAHNYANVIGNLESTWTQSMEKMGEKALPNVTDALEGISDWLSKNETVFEAIGAGFGYVAELAGAATIEVLDFASSLVQATEKNGWAGAIDTIVSKPGYTSNIVDKFTAFRNATNGQHGDKSIGEIVDAAADAVLALVGQELNVQEATLPAPTPYDRQVLFDEYGNRRTFKPSSLFYTSPEDLVDTSQLPDVISSAQRKLLPVAVETEPADDAESKMQRVMDAWKLVVDVHGRWSGWNPGGPGLADTTFYDDNRVPRYAKGISYVPSDNFPAFLDRGETVLNRVEAENWRTTMRGRQTSSNTGISREELLDVLRSFSVSLDGRSVGTLVTPYVSKKQAAEYWRNR